MDTQKIGFGKVAETMSKYCPQCESRFSNDYRFCTTCGTPLRLQDPFKLVGRTLLDKYRIDAFVGVGGLSAVYKAFNINTERPLALKILLPHLSNSDDRGKKVFTREAKVASRIIHENIGTIFDAGIYEDFMYLAMEWIEGCSLKKELQKSGPMSYERAIPLIKQIVSALETAHANNILHGDIKPT
jgi:serine/threonine-protein kinase